MKKVLIELKIPAWIVATTASARYAWNSIKWIVKPPRCAGCGARMHAKWYHIEYHNPDNHTRLLVENMGFGEKLCPSCIANEVAEQKPKTDVDMYEHEVNTTCDCCQKEDTVAYRFYETAKIKLHYCIQWWNGFHICRQCTYKALKEGTVRTGHGVYMGNRMCDVGANGLHLNKGKVQLFKWVKW